MDQPAKPFTSEGADTRRWMGRLIIAVILGEAIWGLIVSVMNNVMVPWLGDVMGQSSGLPTSSPSGRTTIPICSFPCSSFALRGWWRRFSTISSSGQAQEESRRRRARFQPRLSGPFEWFRKQHRLRH